LVPADARQDTKRGDPVAADESNAVVDSWIQAWNAHDAEAAEPLVTDDYKRRDPSAPDIDGPEGQRAFIEQVFNALPDVRIEELHRVAEGDLIAVHVILTGTHRGEIFGVPATGATVRFQSQEMYRVRDGKIAEQFVLLDSLGLMQQLGVIPAAS
jgi:steroid delta-isomerase-like uncharacterized protein